MRIAWYSNSPHVNTGYGTQTRMMLPRLTADGHEVVVLGQWGNQTGIDVFPTPNGMVPIWPAGSKHYGIDVVDDQARFAFRDGPGWVISLFDVWTMKTLFRDQRVASWTPVDHYPVTPTVLAWAQTHRTIAMSRFGQRAFSEAGVEAVYIPHALERIYAPTPSDVRERMGVPDDAFLVVMNAANIRAPHVDRKAFQQNLRAFAIFARSHPDAVIYLHTDPDRNDGFRVKLFLQFMQLPEQQTRGANMLEYRAGLIKDETMAEIYSAADVLLSCSMGEGFGLAVAESMACGTPAIVTDFSAQPEIVGDTGWTVACEPYFDEPQGSDFAIPSVAAIIEALEEAYAERGTQKAEARRDAAAARARSEYDADTVYAERWRPYLAELALDLMPKMNRAQRRAKRAA